MTQHNTSLAEQWRHSPRAQGVALGLVLGPVGMLLAYVFSSPDKRQIRLFGALAGSLIAGLTMLAFALIGALTISAT
jgi:hypothetical protein